MERIRYALKISVQHALKISAYFVNYVNIHTLEMGVLYRHKVDTESNTDKVENLRTSIPYTRDRVRRRKQE